MAVSVSTDLSAPETGGGGLLEPRNLPEQHTKTMSLKIYLIYFNLFVVVVMISEGLTHGWMSGQLSGDGSLLSLVSGH